MSVLGENMKTLKKIFDFDNMYFILGSCIFISQFLVSGRFLLPILLVFLGGISFFCSKQVIFSTAFVAILATFLIENFGTLGVFSSIVIALALGAVVWYISTKEKEKILQKYYREIEKMYSKELVFNENILKNSQLSEAELKFFKQDIEKHYKTYKIISEYSYDEKRFPEYAELLLLVKTIFREITETPRNMLEAKDFLYVHLPELKQASVRVSKLSRKSRLTKKDEAQLAMIERELEYLQLAFRQDYLLVTQDERQRLRKIKRDLEKDNE